MSDEDISISQVSAVTGLYDVRNYSQSGLTCELKSNQNLSTRARDARLRAVTPLLIGQFTFHRTPGTVQWAHRVCVICVSNARRLYQWRPIAI